MAELKRYTDFNSLKLAAKSNRKSNIIDLEKVKELESFFESLRKHLVKQTHIR